MEISLNNSTFNSSDGQIMVISGVTLALMQAVNFFIGIPLNMYVIFLLTRAGGLDESVFFAVSQSASEIAFALSAPLYVLCELRLCLSLVMTIFNGFGMTARLMFQCLVCVERYLAVVHPITFLKFKPLKYRLFCLTVAWICVLTWCVALSISSSKQFPLDIFGSFYLIIVVVELFCCVSILKVLKHPAPGKREDSGMSATKKKAFRIVLVNLLTHLLQMVPLIVIFPLKKSLSWVARIVAEKNTVAVNIAGGLMFPFFFLYRAGKLRINRPSAKTTTNTTNMNS